MMATGKIRNVPASVRQRLLNLAREERSDFNLVLQRYAIERFLYRLGLSAEVDHFTLKGATLFLVWTGRQFRATHDVDFLASGREDRAGIRLGMEAICAVPCPEDGVVFDPASMRIEDIRGEQEYGGMRVRLGGELGEVRLAVQADLGFGDVVTPGREQREYPTLLYHPAPLLWTYPRETFVAEKCEAMVRLGRSNSRLRDFWDIAVLARHFAFDGETLSTAIGETFRRRRTALSKDVPEALQPAFYEDSMRAGRWQEFQRQVERQGYGPARFVDLGEELRRFLGPLWDALIDGEPFPRFWPAGGPWQPAAYRNEGDQGDV